jgi:chromate transporter
MSSPASHASGGRLLEIASIFLRLGVIAFGGPVAHIALLDREVVERRQWLSRERFLDLLGVTNLIPGPNSTELAIHIGYERAGLLGLWVAGACFILPAMLIVWGLAVLYVHYQTLPQLDSLLYGIKPVIVAIIGQALVKFALKAAPNSITRFAAGIALIGYSLGWNELGLLFGVGVAVMLLKTRQPLPTAVWLAPLSSITPRVLAEGDLVGERLASETTAVSGLTVFWIFLKIGAVLYGSGYVLLAFLQRELVERHHWLTAQQLLDAVTIGQITPGPVLTTATFVGYLLAGHAGAIAGTVGIFLPAFLFVWLVNPWVPKLRQSVWASGFLDGVNAASLGLMMGVSYSLARAALVDPVTIILGLLSIGILWRWQINSIWLVLLGGCVGWVYQFFL